MKDETLKRKQKLKLDSEQTALLAAIWRTEANITVTERSLADLRAKHHNQCAELVRLVRRSVGSK